MSNISISGDTSGTVTLQAPAVAGTTTLTLPTTSGTVLTSASGQTLASPTITGTATLNGVNMTPYSMKNRIINGAMLIDQRNAGASVTPTNNQYTVDRWAAELTQASKFTVQQVSGNANTTQGFQQSLRVTSSSAYSVLSTDVFDIKQQIEGYNIADLAWGTSGAKTVTLSFWVYSSLTGTFGGSITNDGSYSYAFSYTISAANTWEQKTVTIAGPTVGTWNSTNGTGLYVRFNLGCGSNYLGTANTWVASNTVAPTGSTSIVGTNGATWYLVGVQFEVGSVASAFEWRPYGTEFMLCQRYYETSANDIVQWNGNTTSGGQYQVCPAFAVTKRAAPGTTATIVYVNGFAATDPTIYNTSVYSMSTYKNSNSTVTGGYYQFKWTASAEL